VDDQVTAGAIEFAGKQQMRVRDGDRTMPIAFRCENHLMEAPEVERGIVEEVRQTSRHG
jgi:hypothetical protein